MIITQYAHLSVHDVLKDWLYRSVAHHPVSLVGKVGYTNTAYYGYLLSLEKEDGSGYCWNVKLLPLGSLKRVTVFVQFPKSMRLVPKHY